VRSARVRKPSFCEFSYGALSLLAQNVNVKYLQTLLGHATASITLDTYSHILPSMADATAVAMERVLADDERAG
jgi:integrase